MKTEISLTLTRWDGKNTETWTTTLKGKSATNYLDRHKLGNSSWENLSRDLPEGVVRITFSSPHFGFTIGNWKESFFARAVSTKTRKWYDGLPHFQYPTFKREKFAKFQSP